MAFMSDEGDNLTMVILDGIVNILFLCDIVVQFFTAFYDADYNIVDEKKVYKLIFIHYS